MRYKSYEVFNPNEKGFDSKLLSTKSYHFTGDVANIAKNIGNAEDVPTALENLEKAYNNKLPDMRDNWDQKSSLNPFKELLD